MAGLRPWKKPRQGLSHSQREQHRWPFGEHGHLHFGRCPHLPRAAHIITFDPQQNTFHLSPAEGRSLVFLNSKAVLTPQELKPYDEVLLGATKLRFIPFCGEKFKWS